MIFLQQFLYKEAAMDRPPPWEAQPLPPDRKAQGWYTVKIGNCSCWVFDGRKNIQAVKYYYENQYTTVLDSIIRWFKERFAQ
jgi:hypothetical protein